VRIKALFSLAVLGYASLALAQATPAQNVVVEEKKTETVTVVVKETPKPPAFVFELHGFVSTTMYFQDANFAINPGQNALWIGASYGQDKPLFGADIRQTRLNFSVRGPEVMGGAVPKAVVEFDMFGSSEFLPSGSFGDVSIVPRIRVAYVELAFAGTIIQIGQQNMLTIGTIPQSLSHIAFPATYTAGTVGWRQPGIWGWHTIGKDLKLELAWSVQKSGWVNTPAELANSGGINAGVASGLPAFEARAKVSAGKAFDIWVSGHWQTVDRNGPNVLAVDGKFTDMVTALGTFGLKLDTGMLVLQGSAWWGKNTGPLLGNILQFAPVSYAGDIWGWGAWGQAGLNFSKKFSIWYTYGIDHPSYADIWAAGLSRMRNQNMVGMVRYQDGGFAIGAEWLYSRTTVNAAADVLTGNQISITGNYYF
jgi:hypothetical protein